MKLLQELIASSEKNPERTESKKILLIRRSQLHVITLRLFLVHCSSATKCVLMV